MYFAPRNFQFNRIYSEELPLFNFDVVPNGWHLFQPPPLLLLLPSHSSPYNSCFHCTIVLSVLC